ncbi:MAG: FAD-binding protein [Desulfobacteraceae bacterium]|jgi:fumarate reductase flavoprotein subunit
MKKTKTYKSNSPDKLVADVVIIGSGAGLCGAIAAAEKGANVIVLERLKKTGGNASLAAGILAAESPVQKRLKIDATKKFLFKASMDYAKWMINPRIVKAFIDKSGETIQWLEKIGVIFEDIPFCYPNQFPRIFHVVSGHGHKLIYTLQKRCEELGVKILCETAADKISIDSNGKVTGVTAKHKEKSISIEANAVLIATRGYSGNKQLMKKYYPYYSDTLQLYGKPYQGDGLRMAIEAGAAKEGLGAVIAMGPLFEGSNYVHVAAMECNTVWLNKNGERFINEDIIPSASSNALNMQPDRISFTLFASKIKEGFINDGTIKAVEPQRYPAGTRMTDLDNKLKKEEEKGTVKISRSLKEIAKWIGTDLKTLKNTITEYNKYCKSGQDEDFYKDRRFLQPLKTPPFYALRCTQAHHGTIGGIKINHHMEVINSSDKRIPGLYASGNDAGGWVAGSYPHHLTGTALSFALNSARIAGENAAEYIKK